MQEWVKICSAFGLSSAAGLNAYIPLLTLGIMANQHVITLASPFNVLAQPWCIGLLVVLLIVEIVVDKVPGADHINDIIHTIIRPASGALLFASQAGTVSHIHPAVWVVLGLLTSGGVHTVKSLTRPAVNVATAGIGAPILSTLEDLVGTTLSIVAILTPVLSVILMAVFAFLLYRLFRWFFGPRRRQRGVSPPVQQIPALDRPRSTDQPISAPATRWGGGV